MQNRTPPGIPSHTRARGPALLGLLLALCFELDSSIAHAVTLLPGEILVSSESSLIVIDLEDDRAEVVSSTTTGSGLPWRSLRSFDLADDGFVYAAVLGNDAQAAIIRIDPVDGDRTLVSSNERGQGPALSQPRTVLAARDGSLYVADVLPNGDLTTARVFRIDPLTGDRTLVAESREGEGGQVSDMEELPDGRLLIVTGQFRRGPATRLVIWSLDPAVGEIEQVPRRFAFEGTLPAIARGSTLERARLIEDGSAFYRIIDPFDGGGDFTGVIADCSFEDPDFARRPVDLAFDAQGSLIVVASAFERGCRPEGPGSGLGYLYRVDPDSGAVELVFDSDGRDVDAGFQQLVIVREDFPFPDADGDGIADALDNCPLTSNPEQADLDGDGEGDACNDARDRDGDEFADGLDVCVEVFDPLQLDGDADGIGDACDPFPDDANNEAAALRVELEEVRAELSMCRADLPGDADGDGVFDELDLCPSTPAGSKVDRQGCAIDQFCALFEIEGRRGLRRCARADWWPEAGGRLRDCKPKPWKQACVPR